jgi:hypothetical protein
LVASVKKIKENPDQLKRVIKAGIKANRYLHPNRDGHHSSHHAVDESR